MSHESPFTINAFLVDENGDYVLTESGDKIIIGSTTIVKDRPEYRRLGGVARRDIRYIRSFQVSKRTIPTGEEWLLKVNRHQLVGRYPDQQAALQVLLGLFTRIASGSDHAILASLSDMLSRPGSFIDPAENGLRVERDNADIVGTLSDYTEDAIEPHTGTLMVGLQYSDANGDFAESGAFANLSLQAINSGTADGDNLVYTFVSGWLNLPEGHSARIIIVDMDGSTLNWTDTNVIGSPVLEKEVPKVVSFTNEISGDSVTVVDVVLGDQAHVIITDSSTGVSPTFTHEWFREIPDLTSLTIENLDS